ncbi:uncharacterized protein Z518_05116 [Rhinocladiella mackenziei CBS 650.93]|uniref:Arylsulfatase n=1 Tax=Rhinocladiella mackenziei CBS 650.93 TaxID=1442369 RepID=A0A0D2IMX3_9EURO|nr:uncharacterized protein Z518_05116 [Rhinocladiella mackenziei CBS 650.93]KIX07139.1 hypothetical protein Z518_05116 [Rhinocladiella mackenziei CBS 650.93]
MNQLSWWKYSILLLAGSSANVVPNVLGSQLQQPLESGPTTGSRPNIVFILTDDQDLHLDSLSYMPHVKKNLIDRGTLFQRHYCTIALCCPSRVSLWTGRAAHNTNVTDVNPPYGGYPKFVGQGFNEAWLPIWLQNAGYNTYYTGKLFNAHSLENYNSPFPAGFTGSDFLLDPYTYEYLNASFQRNQESPVSHEGEYSTDVLAGKAYGFLEDAIAEQKPFFLAIAPNAPHSNVKFKEDWFNGNSSTHAVTTTPPIPAERHKHLFQDAVVPRNPGFNPKEASKWQPHGVSWVSRLPRQNQTVVDFNDEFYRNRLRALQAVDEIVDGVVTRLAEHEILNNTYIFYSSDNGYHIGQHRLQPGKECGFEEDINVPLIIRGPGVPQNQVSTVVTSHTDLAPTFLSLAGADLRPDFDGTAIPLKKKPSVDVGAQQLGLSDDARGEHVNIEYWGFALAEGKYDQRMIWNNTYKGLRLIGNNYNFYYSVWCNGEHELYDLINDPYETKNLYKSNHFSAYHFASAAMSRSAGEEDTHTGIRRSRSATSTKTTTTKTTIHHLLSRLDSLVLVLKTCKARSCTHPWEVLHPTGNVKNLHDALDSRYDDFYEIQQERVRFDKCEKGYILESEGPRHVKSFSSSLNGVEVDVGPRGGAAWAELV